jgi:hypothetical protein
MVHRVQSQFESGIFVTVGSRILVTGDVFREVALELVLEVFLIVSSTIDNLLDSFPISFGFDTACRTYSELIGNVNHDTLSSQKYYHFIRLMGRAASNIALECALQTRPNVCLISEEIEQKHLSLSDITQQVCFLGTSALLFSLPVSADCRDHRHEI